MQVLHYLGPVAVEAAGGKPPHVLQQDGARAGFLDQPKRLWEQVAVSILAKLLPGDGERWAGHASGEQVDARVSAPVQVVNIVFDDCPSGAAVELEGLDASGSKLDRGFVGKPCLFQAE